MKDKYQNLDADVRQAIEDFKYTVLEARDALQPIVDGTVHREHCVGSRECYGGIPGDRKVTLKDARVMAKTAIAKINRAINTFDEEL